MPGRYAVSGNVSPGTQDNINVAMPKLTTPSGRTQSNLQSEPQPTSSRPKRKVSRPVRYSNYVFEPPTKKRASTASVMSSLKSTPTPTKSGLVLTTLSRPIKQPESELEDSDNIFKPAGYSADFLTNFIQDAPPSDELKQLPASDAQQEDLISGLNGQLTSDVVPDSISAYELPSESTSGAPNATFTKHNPHIITSTPIPTQSKQLDSPDQIIKKLQVACHALSNLNIPPVPHSAHLQSPQPGQQQYSAPPPEFGSSDPASTEGAQFLLDAAAGSRSSEPQESPRHPLKIGVGASDDDLLFLIHNAIQILHNHVVSKNQLQGRAGYLATGNSSKARGGGKKRAKKGQSVSDVEGFAISALQQLFDGGATNINCFVSKERSHLMWHLYTQLQYLVMAPQYALPRPYHFLPQTVNGMMATYSMGPPVMGPPMMMQQPQLIMPLQNGIPPPHQFLGRRNSGQYISRYPMNPILMDQSKIHEQNRTVAHMHMLPSPAMMGGFPRGDMAQPMHTMSSQPQLPPQHVMMNQSNFPIPYNTFPPTLRQIMYLPTQQLQYPLAPSQNFNYQQMPSTSPNDLQSRAPVTPSNFGFPAPVPALPSRSKSSRDRPKSSGLPRRSERIVAREGNQQSMPANVSVQRIPAPVILGND